MSDQIVEMLDGELDRLRDEVARLEAARALLTGDRPQGTKRPAAKPAAPPRPAKDARTVAARKLAAERVDCPGCGRTFSRPGLGPHRKACTPPPAAKPSSAVPKPEAPQVTATRPVVPMYGCDHCDREFTARGDLARHRLLDHPDIEDED